MFLHTETLNIECQGYIEQFTEGQSTYGMTLLQLSAPTVSVQRFRVHALCKTWLKQIQWCESSRHRARLTLLRDHDICQDNGLKIGSGQALPGLLPCLGAGLYRPAAAIVFYS